MLSFDHQKCFQSRKSEWVDQQIAFTEEAIYWHNDIVYYSIYVLICVAYIC